MSSKLRLSLGPLLAACVAASPAALAAGFAAGISPNKFELEAQPGDVVRSTVTIVNPATTESDYLFRTADWRLNETSGVEFIENTLAEDSCRPWVRLERRTIRLGGGDQKNYRFEIHVPEDAAPGLCRFAILVEPAEAFAARVGGGSVTVPIVGRYAIITYVTIGDAAAEVEFLGLTTDSSGGPRLPALMLRNSGNALDRAFGQITATDREGRQVSLVPSNFPVLPGRTERIPLLPETGPAAGGGVSADYTLLYPIHLRGRFEIGGDTIRIDETVE